MKRTAKAPMPTYRVWVEQVNQTYLDVKAKNPRDAEEKGYREWRRECGHSRVTDVQKRP